MRRPAWSRACVAPRVNTIECDAEGVGVRPATVRLMPSMATNPFMTMYGISDSGRREGDNLRIASRAPLENLTDAVDVSLHVVAAHPSRRPRARVRG